MASEPTTPLAARGTLPRDAAPVRERIADDKPMLRAAMAITKDLGTANPRIYWPDMLASVAVGYAALAGAILVDNLWAAIAFGIVSMLAIYRALMFIHEISHLHRNALPGFRTAWNWLIGVPLLTPSFMYEGVHTLHHKRTQYGTIEDPEYLPLALMNWWSLPVFVLVALLAPVALLFRYAVLNPLSVIFPPLRQIVWQRFSALSINPDFRRRPPEGDLKPRVLKQEIGGTLWSWFVLASPFWLGWKPLLVALGVFSAVALANQIRTLVAHLWENDGEAMTVTAQYLDSVNVPPPSPLAVLWAPVGLRYHALHHLMPSMPYHSLGEAHRRLKEGLEVDSSYHGANYPGLRPLVVRLSRSTMRPRP
ncbi:fatty acid desaturase family protein [Pseudoblastomonas halimionae]|uniref:Fatty acid desaturase n=1 Tax=Alteriqipengyuania halimionae TaxID=1926630 RepID=A0A6I4U472_9SPHN|nr:fatty acid desaturase [Alteriqipengyuania halimionae]MXP10526.1 fatty acid desaturase [Alteriqipengyuania halimionae]